MEQDTDLGNLNQREQRITSTFGNYAICHQCGKKYFYLSSWLRYKRWNEKGRLCYFCSWTCTMAYERSQKKNKKNNDFLE